MVVTYEATNTAILLSPKLSPPTFVMPVTFFFRDFGLARVLQMVWRLNFLVGLLCLVTGNSYILYYICPLHTFYFFVVYAFMAVRNFPH